jgi:hypothetical protein
LFLERDRIDESERENRRLQRQERAGCHRRGTGIDGRGISTYANVSRHFPDHRMQLIRIEEDIMSTGINLVERCTYSSPEDEG